MADAVYAHLYNRCAIIISGNDRYDFLQGLVTQDIALLQSQPLIYSCLLTPNGKFLYDFFIYEDNNQFILDCEGGERASALLSRLSMFKLRSDITMELKDKIDVFQIFEGESDEGKTDPRFDGNRAYSKPQNSTEVDFKIWDGFRIRNEIPDGSRDLIPEKSFLHESAVIISSAVSMTKGCYMGQELVSRMHHRGLIKKQLKYIKLSNLTEVSELRSSCEDDALALIRL